MAEVLERGNIYFVYRPKVEHTSAAGLEDIQRFFIILNPFNKQRYRLIVIGRKKLPAITGDRERNWGFVQKVSKEPEDIEDELDRLTYSTDPRRAAPVAGAAGRRGHLRDRASRRPYPPGLCA